jgi:hypothetical protein
MMLIDMTTQLGSLLAALDVVLVMAATAIAASAWHHQRASFSSPAADTRSTQAVVGRSSSAPKIGEAPSDTSVSEAA